MDAHGIEMMLLSLNAPVVQAIPERCKGRCRWRARANDYLAEEVRQKPPGRFQGLRGAADAGP